MTLYLVLKYLHIVSAAVLLGTGALLMNELGVPLSEGWIALSLILYLVTGAFWLPVVWIQMRPRDLAQEATTRGTALPASYHRLFRAWFWSGFPAFASVMAIFWLMIAKPTIRLF